MNTPSGAGLSGTGRVHRGDDGAPPASNVYEAFSPKQREGTVSCADGDSVNDGKFGDGRQPVAGLELARADLLAQGFGDDLVRPAWRSWSGDGARNDAGHGVSGAAVGFVDPACVDLERGRAAASVAEPTGD